MNVSVLLLHDHREVLRNNRFTAVFEAQRTALTSGSDRLRRINAHSHQTAVSHIEEVAVRFRFRNVVGVVPFVDSALVEHHGDLSIVVGFKSPDGSQQGGRHLAKPAVENLMTRADGGFGVERLSFHRAE